jgi:hypothetical protein
MGENSQGFGKMAGNWPRGQEKAQGTDAFLQFFPTGVLEKKHFKIKKYGIIFLIRDR